jgi:hypothetical protein
MPIAIVSRSRTDILTHMIATYRHLLAALLLLAIPLQGYAASTMLFCKSGHHSQISSAENSARASQHSDHGTHAGATSQSPDHHGGAKTAAGEKPATCSACSLCCNLTVLVSSIEALGVSVDHAALQPLQVSPPSNPSLKGLKRPPRALLA